MNVTKTPEFRVELKNISKLFGGITALKNVTFRVRRGEVHILIGENGAGKSTLMKILSGAYQMDQGNIFLDGENVRIRNTHDSKSLGIGIIYQEFSLVPELSVAENVFLGELKQYGLWLNWGEIKKKASKLIHDIGFDIEPTAKVKNLSIAQQQVVEIAKALALDVKVLILDEPSAVLGIHEIKTLFNTINTLKKRGVSVIYISHRLEELFEIGDRVTVLRNGSTTGTLNIAETNKEEIIRLMLGRPLEAMYPKHDSRIGDEILHVTNICVPNRVRDVSFSVKAGEIVGIAGLVGSGRTEILESIFASRKRFGGAIALDGKRLDFHTPKGAVRNGIGMIPEDRKSQGLLLNLSVKENISITNLSIISNKLGFILTKKERDSVMSLIDILRIKTENQNTLTKNLSGGNQQKIVLAKWLNINCRVLLIDEPTRGVDVGAKVDIYNEIYKVADNGVGVIVVSSETNELLNICDRILVMHEGVLQGALEKDQFSEENVLRFAMNEGATIDTI